MFGLNVFFDTTNNPHAFSLSEVESTHKKENQVAPAEKETFSAEAFNIPTIIGTDGVAPAVTGLNPKNEFFTEIYNSIERQLRFRPEWKNGTGYFDGINSEDHGVFVNLDPCAEVADHDCRERCMVPGEMAKSQDDHGRRIIVVATRMGVVAVFQRYKDNDQIFVFNAPLELERSALRDIRGSLNLESLRKILGSPATGSDNIGAVTEHLYAAMTSHTEAFKNSVEIVEPSKLADVLATKEAIKP